MLYQQVVQDLFCCLRPFKIKNHNMDKDKNKFDVDVLLGMLEKVAEKHKADPDAYHAVEVAAKAILFIDQGGLNDAFLKYLREFNEDLTDEQKQFLKDIGL